MIDLEYHSSRARAHARPTHGHELANRSYSRSWIVGALLLAAGCGQSSEGPTRAPSKHGQEWAAPEGVTGAVIRKVRVAGSLCPSDARRLSVSDDGHALALDTSSTLDASNGRSDLEGDCKLTLDLDIPAGMTLGNPALSYLLNGNGPIELTTRYAFSNQAPVRGGTVLINFNGVIKGQDRPLDLWSPTCDGGPGSQRAELSFDIHARVLLGAVLAGASIELDLKRAAEWRPCDAAGSGASGARKGEACTLTDRPCGKDLVCELTDDPRLLAAALNNGRCVVEGEPASRPSVKLEPCGGVNDLRCEEDLRCQWSSKEHAAPNVLGRCVSARGGFGESCAGYPDVPCETGYTCVGAAPGDPIKFCEPIGRAEGDFCETSADCDPGFDCVLAKGQIKHCTARVALRGDECGPGVAICGVGDSCDQQLKRCVAAGDEEAQCKTSEDCLPHLRCTAAGRCTDPRAGLGEPCRALMDCKPSFVCVARSFNDRRCAVPGTAGPGEDCLQPSDCRSLNCLDGECQRATDGTLDARCKNDAQCNGDLVCGVDDVCGNP